MQENIDFFSGILWLKLYDITIQHTTVTMQSDKVRLNSFLCRCWKLGYSDRNMTFEDMCADADEQLNRLIHNPNHVLCRLLPPPTTASQRYNLRSRRHRIQLPEHHTSLLDSFSLECFIKTFISILQNSTV